MVGSWRSADHTLSYPQGSTIAVYVLGICHAVGKQRKTWKFLALLQDQQNSTTNIQSFDCFSSLLNRQRYWPVTNDHFDGLLVSSPGKFPARKQARHLKTFLPSIQSKSNIQDMLLKINWHSHERMEIELFLVIFIGNKRLNKRSCSIYFSVIWPIRTSKHLLPFGT